MVDNWKILIVIKHQTTMLHDVSLRLLKMLITEYEKTPIELKISWTTITTMNMSTFLHSERYTFIKKSNHTEMAPIDGAIAQLASQP